MLIGIFVKKNESNIEDFFTKLINLNYPTNKLHIFLYKEVSFFSVVTLTFLCQILLQVELLTNIKEAYLYNYSDVKIIYQVSEESANKMAL